MKRLVAKFGISPWIFVFGLFLGSALTTAVWAAQPHMTNALNDLQSAKSELQQADPDKGGYRTKAINTINHAIFQVQAGINWAARH